RALAHQPREPGLLGDPALAAERLLARPDRRDDAGRRDETDGLLAYPEAARAWAPLRQPARAVHRGVRPAEPAPQRQRADRGASVGAVRGHSGGHVRADPDRGPAVAGDVGEPGPVHGPDDPQHLRARGPRPAAQGTGPGLGDRAPLLRRTERRGRCHGPHADRAAVRRILPALAGRGRPRLLLLPGRYGPARTPGR